MRDIENELDVLRTEFYTERDEVRAKIIILSERAKCDDHNRRMSVLEGRVENVVDEVRTSTEKIDGFITRHEAAQNTTRWWFIGSVLVSLIVGSYFQERRFIDVNREVNTVNTRLDKMSLLDSIKVSSINLRLDRMTVLDSLRWSKLTKGK